MKIVFFTLLFFLSVKSKAQLTPDSLGLKITKLIACSSVKDQYQSSTCWSFASTSFIESELMNNKIDVDLSEMFVVRYSYINKLYQYLAQKGKTFFTPGGQFHDLIRVVKEHGIVPESVYKGKPNGELNYDQGVLDTLMNHFAKSLLEQKKLKPTKDDLNYINKILDKYIGKVPKTFLYKGTLYSPKTFAKDVLHFNINNYLEITSYNKHPYYKSFVLEDKYNWSLDNYLNVPLPEFIQITDSALANGYTVCWDGDITEVGFQYENGIAFLNDSVKNYEQERQTTYNDQTTTIDHMMQIVGVAKDKDGCKWYYIKNSWGDYSNSSGGYLFMKDDYFKIKTVAIVINKNSIPELVKERILRMN